MEKMENCTFRTISVEEGHNTTSLQAKSENSSTTSSSDMPYFRTNTTASPANEMLNAENGTLRDRVSELERKVQAQEDELVCLRSSTADILRRVNAIEIGEKSQNSRQNRDVYARLAGPNRALSSHFRSTSQSQANISHYTSMGSLLLTPTTLSCDRRTVSPSPIRSPIENGNICLSNKRNKIYYNNNNQTNGQRVTSRRPPPPAKPPKLVNVHTGTSPRGSPMRKWLSSQDMHDSAISTNNHSLPRSYNTHRDPVYFAEHNLLQMFIRGRPINLHVPTFVINNNNNNHFNPTTEMDEPKTRLNLEWVYGYRGKDCRSNLHYLPTGELLYFTATVLVLHNPEDRTQRHYTQHTSEIKCVCVHPNRLLVASGQSAASGYTCDKKNSTTRMERQQCPAGANFESDEQKDSLVNDMQAHVRIWDSITLQTLCVLGLSDTGLNLFERSISCLAFSKTDNGSILAVVDESYEHTMSLWQWNNKCKLTETKSANEQVFSCEFHPTARNLLVTCGKSHLSFWTFDGNTLQKKVGLFEGRDKPKYVLCACFIESGEVASGDSNGTICIWDQKVAKITNQIARVHPGGVFSLCSLKGGRILSGGGGKDRSLIEWTVDLKQLAGPVQVPEIAGSIRTIAAGPGSMILIGTTYNCILMGDMTSGLRFLVQSHTDEVNGLCTHPIQQQFVTCGRDKWIRCWDSASQSLLWSKQLADSVKSVCFHPSGSILVAGTENSGGGRWLALDAQTRDVISGQKDGANGAGSGQQRVSCLQFSANGKYLAVAGQDSNIYLYTVADDLRKFCRMAVCTGHTGCVTAVDWSTDGHYFRSNSTENDLLFWSSATGKLVPDVDKTRDIEWATHRCPLSFNTFGIWPENSNGSEVRSVDTCSDSHYCAVGSDSGLVRLFPYPVISSKAKCISYGGHGSRVNCVRLLQNGTRLISIGASDCTTFQWRVIND